MNKEILDRMPEWYRILMQAVEEYPVKQADPSSHLNRKENQGGSAE